MDERQLTFHLPVRAALGRDDFFVSRANAAALATLENWDGWPNGKMMLVGPEGSGKTHLVQVWAAETGARVLPATGLARSDLPALAAWTYVAIEDADRIAGHRDAEVALFHLHNLLAGEGRLLLTARSAPNRWPLVLPDLASRLQATAIAQLDPPDDSLLAAVLVKHFADRQLNVPASVIPYLASRMDRSLAAARRLVERIDLFALASGRGVSRALVAEVLAQDLGHRTALDTGPGDGQ